MAYKITDKCIACGACAANCPVSCISDKGSKYEIDSSMCIAVEHALKYVLLVLQKKNKIFEINFANIDKN